ncbi:hypothetical protein F4680DRAFT_423786 [Xylaria scruposa]|nr:hypothetical protein F4680DRAFT_423786 [Xylaria scruposa]
MAYVSSSEDEFPEIEVIARRQKQKTTVSDQENASKQSSSTASIQSIFDDTIGKTPATARRVRKLGQGQPMDGSLLKPWQSSEVERGTSSRTPRQPSWAQDKRRDASAASPRELLDRLPARIKRTESRTVSGSTIFDSPPKEQKKTRRLISRGEKKALSSKITKKEDDWIVSSDESGSDDEKYGSDNIYSHVEDEESDFSLGDGSGSDKLSITPPQRSQSPSGPRRMQRRVLSSSRDPIKKEIKKEPTRTKPTRGNTITSPKKQPEKQKAPKVSTTRQLKAAPKGNLEDVFEKLKIFNEESEPEEPVARDASTPTTEPMTPRKNLTASPAKAPPIPMSPWKPEHKEFWDPEVNFAWIDQHSPPKKSTKKSTMPDLAAPENKEELKRRYGTSPEKKQAKKAFDAVKEDLARDFLVELDEVVTDGELARLTETTGGLRIEWSNTLLTTAGRAHWKCKTTTTTSRQPSAPSATKTTSTQHYASIELATKVLSNESDLLNTVAHEFCHLAVFLLHGKPKQAHGPEFKTYGRRVMMSASDSSNSKAKDAVKKLKAPRDRGVEINVTTRHSYEIEYRFVWRCADCGGEVRRHSRSVDPTRQRCGRCKQGILVQVKPVPRGSGGSAPTSEGAGLENSRDLGTIPKAQPKPEKKKTAYQEFTSREMKALSVSHKGLSFGEKMTMVSARWSEHQKLTKLKTDGGVGSAGGSVKGLAAAVEVLEIKDDFGSDEGGTGEKKDAYDIFA